jgi:hypothetical protein
MVAYSWHKSEGQRSRDITAIFKTSPTNLNLDLRSTSAINMALGPSVFKDSLAIVVPNCIFVQPQDLELYALLGTSLQCAS